MKQFSKIVFASMIGTFMALVFLVFSLMSLVTLVSTLSGDSNWGDAGEVKDQSVLRIVLDGPIKDYVERRDLISSIMNYDEPPVIGLFEVSQTLERSAKDDRIKGLFLHFKNFRGGFATLEGLRREIIKFKQSGKFVIAYAETYSEMAYVVASAADEVVLYPKGYFEWDGLFSKMIYVKNTLQKLDVEPQIFRVGKYKSAIEPFINEEMSEESREQVNAIISTAWGRMLIYAAEKTKLNEEELDRYADEMSVLFASSAFEKGFVNLLASYEEVEQKLMELTGAEKEPSYTSWRAYYKSIVEAPVVGGNKVALLFASGGIQTEEGDNSVISSEKFAKLINEVRRDEDVKAVVVRVSSPGGSALASDVIWTATQWLKDAKPVVTSFGDVAASGGYYMSAGSQYIFAEPTTITGSIGVFGLSFATKQFWNDRVGMTFDTVKSHRFSDLESLVRKMEPDEKMKMQEMVDGIYEDFLSVVLKGRPKLLNRDNVHMIAQGRVWTGEKAQELGLVDELGGVNQAVAKAADLAKLKDYTIEVFPKERTAIEEFLVQFSGASTLVLKNILPEGLQKLLSLSTKKPLHEQIHTRMPFDIVIE